MHRAAFSQVGWLRGPLAVAHAAWCWRRWLVPRRPRLNDVARMAHGQRPQRFAGDGEADAIALGVGYQFLSGQL